MSLEQRYRRAERLSQLPVTKEVLNTEVLAHWLPHGNSFWYEREIPGGRVIRLVNPNQASNQAAFDHAALCEALQRAAGEDAADITPQTLPLSWLRLELEPLRVSFTAFGKRWRYDAEDARCSEIEMDLPAVDRAVSPDGRYAAFVRDHNLWLHDSQTGSERALTEDGEADCAYGVESDMRRRYPNLPPPPKPPALVWSDDSRRVLSLRIDQRQVLPVPIIEHVPFDGSQRPRVHTLRLGAPGDEHVPSALFSAIDVETGTVTHAENAPVPLVRMNDSFIDVGLAWFGRDNRHAYFVDVERGEKRARVVEFDTDTGATRTVFSEESEASLELGPNVYTRTNVHYLRETHELIWQSERSGWAHLYRYDLTTGELKNALTQGEWRVRDVIAVDEARAEVWFTASGQLANVYNRQLYRVGLDGRGLTCVTVADADHSVLSQNDFGLMMLQMFGKRTDDLAGISPDGAYVVETRGTIGEPSVSSLRDRDGRMVMELETADFAALDDLWRWPEAFEAIAADGTTTIHGVVFKPSDFDPERRYPVIDLIYGGPQVSYVPKAALRSFEEQLNQTDALSLAELGCVVVVVDGRGTAMRERAFHKHSYGQVHLASDIDDHIAAIRQLAEERSYMDLDRVGITGISGGGYATAGAMLRRPEFYKVGVASSGNYDQRFFTHGWGERYQGLVDGDNYVSQALTQHADQLEGKLLFTHGMLDFGCHPAALFQLINALAAANKDYDLILEPVRAHERSSYLSRRMWDYFVTHLLGQTPPPDVSITHGLDLLIQQMQ